MSEQKNTKSTRWVLPVWPCCLMDTLPAAGTASNSKARARASSLLATDFGLGLSRERSGLLKRWCKVWTHQNTLVCDWQSLHPAGHSGMNLRLDFKLRLVFLAETDDNPNFQGRTWVLKHCLDFRQTAAVASSDPCLLRLPPQNISTQWWLLSQQELYLSATWRGRLQAVFLFCFICFFFLS